MPRSNTTSQLQAVSNEIDEISQELSRRIHYFSTGEDATPREFLRKIRRVRIDPTIFTELDLELGLVEIMCLKYLLFIARPSYINTISDDTDLTSEQLLRSLDKELISRLANSEILANMVAAYDMTVTGADQEEVTTAPKRKAESDASTPESASGDQPSFQSHFFSKQSLEPKNKKPRLEESSAAAKKSGDDTMSSSGDANMNKGFHE